MSVLIKGMDMPESCLKCPFTYEGDCTAKEGLFEIYLFDKILTERHPDCPLVEVPTPHGRLIDADRLYEKIEQMCKMYVTEALGVKKDTFKQVESKMDCDDCEYFKNRFLVIE